MTSIETLYDSGWIARYRPAGTKDCSRLLIMLHGWTGDENSMGVFIKGFDPDFHILSPRAPFHAIPSGFSWVIPSGNDGFPTWEQFSAITIRLVEQIANWKRLLSIKSPATTSLLGFSQGAALALVLGLAHPREFSRVAAISGFLPKDVVLPNQHVSFPPFFVAHGVNDSIVSVEESRNSVSFLSTIGASVTYCESEAKHRMSLRCLPGLHTFLHES